MDAAFEIVKRIELKCGNHLSANRVEEIAFDVFCRMVEKGEIEENLDLIIQAQKLYLEKNGK